MSDDVTVEVRRLAGRTWIAPLGTRTQPPSIEWVRLDANGERADPVGPWDACLDFYEDDESVEQLRAAWDAAPKHLTGMEHEPDHIHGDACEGDCE